MRILRLSVRRLRHHPGVETAADVSERLAAVLLAQRERGVAHVAVSHLADQLIVLAVFLEDDQPGVPEVGDLDGWVVTHDEPGHELW
ncbi:hypothetical protein NOCA2220082 [metagenome]|uniref:Uncharacterized protein n=1 Tax=metagenome TaxID=256318 RepID=A0A2P2BYU4_9ZZZZ